MTEGPLLLTVRYRGVFFSCVYVFSKVISYPAIHVYEQSFQACELILHHSLTLGKYVNYFLGPDGLNIKLVCPVPHGALCDVQILYL